MLPWQAARTLYNILDARWPEAAGRDLAPAIAGDFARRGPGALRGLRLCLAWLDWAPLACGERARFWRLPRPARRRALARWERSLLPPRRRTFAALAAAVESALRPAPPEAPGASQSPPGA